MMRVVLQKSRKGSVASATGHTCSHRSPGRYASERVRSYVCMDRALRRKGGLGQSTPLRGLVYQVLPEEQTVKVLRMWTHYE